MLLWALDTDEASGTYNATSPNPVTNREFSKTLGRVLGRPAVLPVPKLALKARFGDELGEIAAGGQRVVPRRALDAGFEFRHPELEPALSDLCAETGSGHPNGVCNPDGRRQPVTGEPVERRVPDLVDRVGAEDRVAIPG